jgi:hypothetical protein
MSDMQVGQASSFLDKTLDLADSAWNKPFTTAARVAKGVAGASLNKLAREKGNFWMATSLRSATRRAVKVQEAIKKSALLRGITNPKALPAVTVGATTKEDKPIEVKKVIERAERLQDPESEEAQYKGAWLQEMEVDSGPELMQALDKKMTAQNEFILEKAGPRPPPSPFGGPPPQRDLDLEKEEQLSRYLQPLSDPSGALARVGDGIATPEDYEVLESQYPRLWGEFQQTAVHGLADKDLDHDQQIAVAEALKLPLLPQMQGDYMAYWQSVAVGEQADQKNNEGEASLSGGENIASKADRSATV